MGNTYTGRFEYVITMDGSTLSIETDQGYSVTYDYSYNTDPVYFKTGSYCQDSSATSPADGCKVSIYALETTHIN